MLDVNGLFFNAVVFAILCGGMIDGFRIYAKTFDSSIGFPLSHILSSLKAILRMLNYVLAIFAWFILARLL